MKKNDSFLEKVSKKTNVNKDDIISLANSLQTKNLKNEKDIQEFIENVAKLTNKKIEPEKMNKLVDIIKNNKVPKDIENMVK